MHRDEYRQKRVTPLQVGLTGNIGSGKSAVAQLFAERGAAVVDADALAREATRDPVVLARIAAELGEELVKDGELERARVASRIFGDPAAREVLSGIIHPWVQQGRERRVAELLQRTPAPPVIVHDIPLLFEVGLDAEMDKTVVVDAPLERRVARVVRRSALSPAEVRARDAAQLPLADKVRRADFVIDNSGSLEALGAQVEQVWRQLRRSR